MKNKFYTVFALFIVVITFFSHGLVSAAGADIDIDFDIGTGFNGKVNIIQTQNDGKILIGGYFTGYKGITSNGIIRLHPDGSRDNSFDIGSGFDLDVLVGVFGIASIQIQDDGKMIVGGGFATYKGESANNIIRLNSDGSRDNSFDIGSGFYGGIKSIQIQDDGKILLGGVFIDYQGSIYKKIIRLNADGSIDSSFKVKFSIGMTNFNGFQGTVNSIQIQNDGKILVGGQFFGYQGVSSNRIIRLNTDGTIDSSFDIGNGFIGAIYSIQIQNDGKILIGGDFDTYNRNISHNIIRLNSDGLIDTSFDIGLGFNLLNMWVQTIQIQNDGKILVGGKFTTYNGSSVNNIIRLNADGSIDTSFDIGSGFNGTVNSIHTQNDDKILIGGEFTTYNGNGINGLIGLYGDSEIVIIPNSTDTSIVKNEFTRKGYTESFGNLIGSKRFSLSKTNGNIPVNLSLKNNTIKLVIPASTQFKKADNISNYSGIISVPSLKAISNIEGRPVLTAFNVGASERLNLVGGEAILSTNINKAIGSKVDIYYSQDNGITWYPQTTTTVTTVSGQATASFTTNHFTDFALLDGEGSFVINNDAVSTTSANVTLNIYASGAQNMRFQNDSTGGARSAWEDYSTSKARTLPGTYGSKTVYAQIDSDGDGISDADVSDNIMYNANTDTPGTANGNLKLKITGGGIYCDYTTGHDFGPLSASSVMLGEQTITGNMGTFMCKDLDGSTGWNLAIASDKLTNGHPGQEITTILAKADTNSLTAGSCSTGTNTTIYTSIYNSAQSILVKTGQRGEICEISADNVIIRVDVPQAQPIGSYQSVFTVYYPG